MTTIVKLSYKQALFLKKSFVDYLDLDWKEFTAKTGGDSTGKEFIIRAAKLPDATRSLNPCWSSVKSGSSNRTICLTAPGTFSF